MCQECKSRLLLIDKTKKKIIIETTKNSISFNWDNQLILSVDIEDEEKLSIYHRDLLMFHIDKARTNAMLFLVFVENWFEGRGYKITLDYNSSILNFIENIKTIFLYAKCKVYFEKYGLNSFNMI